MTKQPERVILHSNQPLSTGHLPLNKYSISHEAFSGSQIGPMEREILHRGNAVAVLPYDPMTDTVIMIQQFRLAAHLNPITNGWLYEVVAGMSEEGETPEGVAIREAKEEANLDITQLETIGKFHLSPGYSDEVIELFYAQTDATDVGGTHGLDSEHEDIKVVPLPWQSAWELLNNGLVSNSVAVIALQWLALNRERLRAQP